MHLNLGVRLCALLVWLGVFSLVSGQRAQIEDASQLGVIREYCLATEPFQAKCLRNEVIVMTSALYGRMRVGRCLEHVGDEMLARNRNDPLFLGCSVDVLRIMDKRCSGKNVCDVKLFSGPDFQLERPCHAGLEKYLEASYECVTVIEADRSCHVTVSSNPLHIMRSSSSTSAQHNCGTKTQPWVLEAPAGQQINVSLLDFGQRKVTRERGKANQRHCGSSMEYGYIVDKAAPNDKRNISICGLEVERKGIVYQSVSNLIHVILRNLEYDGDSNPNENEQVLFGFEAIGCSNIVPPDDTWLRRNSQEAVVGCYSSHQTWHLRCVGNQWVGVIGNCTRELQEMAPNKASKAPEFENQVLITVAIAVIGLIVCIVIAICGAVCIRRYSAMSKGSGYNHHHDESKLEGGKYWPSTQQAPLNNTTAGTEQLA